jgi:hypothetical protein
MNVQANGNSNPSPTSTVPGSLVVTQQQPRRPGLGEPKKGMKPSPPAGKRRPK